MEVDFLCPRWGFEHIPWEDFISGAKAAGYKGVEWFPYSEQVNGNRIADLLAQNDLQLAIVMTVTGNYRSLEGYLQLLYNQLTAHSRVGKPLFITAQTGREYFSKTEIEECLHCCRRITKETGVPVYQETHRNKWAYAAHIVKPFLETNSDVNLTLDVSHWFCVSESYLEDQQEAVDLAIRHAQHVHARVGHTQGSQVLDPALPQYAEALKQHLKIWDSWIELQRKNGAVRCTITPEFGPPPYLTETEQNLPADKEQWRLNLWMKALLDHRYNFNNRRTE